MARRAMSTTTQSVGGIYDMKTGSFLQPTLPVVCARIKYYRTKQGMEQKQLAELIGVKPSAVSNWETGRSRPDVNLLPVICKTLGITLNQLFRINDPLQNYSAKEQLMMERFRELTPQNQMAVKKLGQYLQKAQQMESLPRFKELYSFSKSLAAGVGDPTEIEDEGEPVLLISSPTVERSDYVFRVNGESMEPTFHDGDRVLVQKAENGPDLKFGEIGAFMFGNELFIKEYTEEGLLSHNQMFKLMKFDEYEGVYLIGRVIGKAEDSDFATPHQVQLYQEMQDEEFANA